MGAVLSTALLAHHVAVAAVVPPVDSGDVKVVDPESRDSEISEGDGNTPFTIRLPDGANCPGDSANDQWRLQSFMVPEGDDIGAISYGVIGPEGTNQDALYGADFAARSFANILLPMNAQAGLPARIENPPAFSFAVAAVDLMPVGTYRIGFACTLFGATAKYWDTPVVVTATSGPTADDFIWRLADAPASVEDSNQSSNTWPLIGILGVGLVALGLFVWRRRGSTALALSKESP